MHFFVNQYSSNWWKVSFVIQIFLLFSRQLEANFCRCINKSWRQRKCRHGIREGWNFSAFETRHLLTKRGRAKTETFQFRLGKSHDINFALLPCFVDAGISWSTIWGSIIKRSNPGTGVAWGTTGWFACSKLHCFSCVNWVSWNVVRQLKTWNKYKTES